MAMSLSEADVIACPSYVPARMETVDLSILHAVCNMKAEQKSKMSCCVAPVVVEAI